MGSELNSVLQFAETLARLDTTDVPPTAHVIPTQNVLREDVPVPCFDRELLLKNAPSAAEGCVTVPKTFE